MASLILPAGSKRKRKATSYSNNDQLDELLDLSDDGTMSDVDDWDDDDTSNYSTGKKAPKQLQRFKKLRISATASKSKAKAPKKPFPFLRLPAELREQIYLLTLTETSGITLVARTKAYRRTVLRGLIPDHNNGGYYSLSPFSRQLNHEDQLRALQETRRELVPALLGTCKQIHDEGVGYLYSQKLVLQDTHALHCFLAAIGSNQKLVTDLTICGWGSGRSMHKAMNYASLTLLANCTNLKSLFFDCGIGWCRYPKALARQIYRDGVYFLEAFGVAKGRYDAAIDILEVGEENYDKVRGWHWRRNHDDTPDDPKVFRARFHEELRKLLKAGK